MKTFVTLLPKIVIPFNKLTLSGPLLGRNRKYFLSFNKDLKGGMTDRINQGIEKYPLLANVDLRDTLPTKYRDFFRAISLRNLLNFLKVLDREKDNMPESNFRVVFSFYAFYLMFICRMVDIYVGACEKMHFDAGLVDDKGNIRQEFFEYVMADLGLTKKELAYYDSFLELRTKTVQEWSALKLSDAELKYIESSFKRIYKVFGY